MRSPSAADPGLASLFGLFIGRTGVARTIPFLLLAGASHGLSPRHQESRSLLWSRSLIGIFLSPQPMACTRSFPGDQQCARGYRAVLNRPVSFPDPKGPRLTSLIHSSASETPFLPATSREPRIVRFSDGMTCRPWSDGSSASARSTLLASKMLTRVRRQALGRQLRHFASSRPRLFRLRMA